MNEKNQTPLHYTYLHNSKGIGELLISKGANMNVEMTNIIQQQRKAGGIQHYYLRVQNQDDGLQKLLALFKTANINQVIVFADTKHTVENICEFFSQEHDGKMYDAAKYIKSGSFGMNRFQRHRFQETVYLLNAKRVKMIVTDVTSSYFDEADVHLVINFEGFSKDLNIDTYFNRANSAKIPGFCLTFVQNDFTIWSLQQFKELTGIEVKELTEDKFNLLEQ